MRMWQATVDGRTYASTDGTRFTDGEGRVTSAEMLRRCGVEIWQIPNRIEDMTPQQRELLGKPPLFGQHLAVGEDGPIMLNISPKDDDGEVRR